MIISAKFQLKYLDEINQEDDYEQDDNDNQDIVRNFQIFYKNTLYQYDPIFCSLENACKARWEQIFS